MCVFVCAKHPYSYRQERLQRGLFHLWYCGVNYIWCGDLFCLVCSFLLRASCARRFRLVAFKVTRRRQMLLKKAIDTRAEVDTEPYVDEPSAVLYLEGGLFFAVINKITTSSLRWHSFVGYMWLKVLNCVLSHLNSLNTSEILSSCSWRLRLHVRLSQYSPTTAARPASPTQHFLHVYTAVIVA